MMPRRCWLLVLVLVWWLPLMLAGVQQEQQGEEEEEGCSGSAKTCGNLTIANPFWLRETTTTTEEQSSSSCVSVFPPDFEVTCLSNDTPALPSSLPSSLGFAITDIFYAQASLRVVNLGKIRLSQAFNGCGIQIWNTSDKLGRSFRIGPANVNLVLYNCTDASAARRDGELLVETGLGCGNETQVFVCVEEEDDETRAIQGCDQGRTYLMVAGVTGHPSDPRSILLWVRPWLRRRGVAGSGRCQQQGQRERLRAAHRRRLPHDMGQPSSSSSTWTEQ